MHFYNTRIKILNNNNIENVFVKEFEGLMIDYIINNENEFEDVVEIINDLLLPILQGKKEVTITYPAGTWKAILI